MHRRSPTPTKKDKDDECQVQSDLDYNSDDNESYSSQEENKYTEVYEDSLDSNCDQPLHSERNACGFGIECDICLRGVCFSTGTLLHVSTRSWFVDVGLRRRYVNQAKYKYICPGCKDRYVKEESQLFKSAMRREFSPPELDKMLKDWIWLGNTRTLDDKMMPQ